MEQSVDRCQKVFCSDDFQKYFSKNATYIYFLKQYFSENKPLAKLSKVKRIFTARRHI